MSLAKFGFISVLVAFSFTATAFAQDAGFQLPEQCGTASGMGEMNHGSMRHGGIGVDMVGSDDADLDSTPAHVQENMRKMMITMPAMQQGMMMEDADVAFTCGMIAHHQGAIDMAMVLLKYGDDPETIKRAEEIIDAQAGEIDQMVNWLAENAN